jgi:UDP-N-acetylmuramate--alanine ligase
LRHKIRKIHFIGIGGAGMSGIAEVLVNLGYQVSCSYLAPNAATKRLAAMGSTITFEHKSDNIRGADAVVVSAAVRADNPEVVAARAKRIPVVPRALMLAELMRLKQGVAIAGTHGKTTTTSLVASVLAEGGLDPTFVIGGRLNAAGSNAKLGAGEFIVVEADESDASFLHLQPVIAVVTNIDADHMDTYQHDFPRLQQAFIQFLHNMPFYGSAVLCAEDPHVREIMPFVSRPIVTYGMREDAMIRAIDVVLTIDAGFIELGRAPCGTSRSTCPGATRAECARRDRRGDRARLPAEASSALAGFRGVGQLPAIRRHPHRQNGGFLRVVDDYGHHPAEIAATLEAARRFRAAPGARLPAAPLHAHARPVRGFVRSAGARRRAAAGRGLSGAAPIAAADGPRSQRRCARRSRSHFVEDVAGMAAAIRRTARAHDVVLTMGAARHNVAGQLSRAWATPSNSGTVRCATARRAHVAPRQLARGWFRAALFRARRSGGPVGVPRAVAARRAAPVRRTWIEFAGARRRLARHRGADLRLRQAAAPRRRPGVRRGRRRLSESRPLRGRQQPRQRGIPHRDTRHRRRRTGDERRLLRR